MGCLAGFAGGGPGFALPAGVGLEGGGSEGFEPGEQLAQPPVVADPGLVVVVLVGAEPAADGFGGDLAGPLPVGAVQAGGARRAAPPRGGPGGAPRRARAPGRPDPAGATRPSRAPPARLPP